MSTPNDISGPAFPIPGETWESEGVQYGSNPHYGMTMRDYFAAKAMHALMTEPSWGNGSSSMVHEWAKDSRTKPGTPERYAFAAYAMADAMLRAREAS